ncbi:ABC transporter ATP-binding protein [Bosea sp. (in: a-proteobacteria)]|uniref:ABC transporter ATP-binding protein n=1 Tax=Bosea sp. (in: a-proteobacteria) TaxID=1871050 RepID=UPI00262FED1C|nr:ABC transporter ATP-binding protein [Bosea sp. (in: a-proteobacteria)]MCO5089664.1 ABC transporter ATP-binding protein [Bosea sp. (in: a-proteobacteria)]
MSAPAILKVENLSVRFGGVKALTDVALEAKTGETTGIIGPNGAGKTTLFNCISGFIRPAGGARILLDGQDVIGRRVDAIARAGIARTFQNISLSRTRTARENILAGMHLSLGYGALAAMLPLPGVARAEAEAGRAVAAVADRVGIASRVLDMQVGALSLGLQKKVEVARALVRGPRLLMLDEPAGGLNDAETRELMDCLRGLRAEPDLSIVLIDHDMNLVMPLCDHICVLNFGQRVAAGPPAAIQADPAVIACYLGTDA